MNLISAEAEIIINGKKKNIPMALKYKEDISECEVDKVCMISLIDGQSINGIIKGMSGEDEFLLKALNSEIVIGLRVDWVAHYFEEIKPEKCTH